LSEEAEAVSAVLRSLPQWRGRARKDRRKKKMAQIGVADERILARPAGVWREVKEKKPIATIRTCQPIWRELGRRRKKKKRNVLRGSTAPFKSVESKKKERKGAGGESACPNTVGGQADRGEGKGGGREKKEKKPPGYLLPLVRTMTAGTRKRKKRKKGKRK